jgi:hypothetical protein
MGMYLLSGLNGLTGFCLLWKKPDMGAIDYLLKSYPNQGKRKACQGNATDKITATKGFGHGNSSDYNGSNYADNQ